VPGDVTTPIANQIMEIGEYLFIVVCFLVLEKTMLTVMGYLAFRILIPVACLLLCVHIFFNKGTLKILACKFIVFAMALVMLIPFSVKISDLVYESNREAVEMLTDEERGKLFSAILNYSEYGELPDFKGALQMAFAFIRTALDRDAEKWEDKRQKRVESGRLGGIRSGEARRQHEANEANASETKQTRQNQANEAVPVPAPVPGIEDKEGKPPRTRFVPPTVEEVADYCRERGNGIDPQAFADYYTSAKWYRGKTKITDWKACVRTWERKEKGRSDTENIFLRMYEEERGH
jgi:hypothetical protein